MKTPASRASRSQHGAEVEKHGIRPGQSLALLKDLHILTREGKLNQDARRKLKQVYHLFNFIAPLLEDVQQQHEDVTLVDHGAGKSYLGFILYDLYFKQHAPKGGIIGVEARSELVQQSQALAASYGFAGMRFIAQSVAEAADSPVMPKRIDIVTALHACDTATDDAIRFGIAHRAQYIVVVPCCQAEVAGVLRKHKADTLREHPLAQLWRHPLHTREFGSQLTNVLRGLQLEASGYQVTITELVGWEHSLKNELIIARRVGKPQRQYADRLEQMLTQLGLSELRPRFFTGL